MYLFLDPRLLFSCFLLSLKVQIILLLLPQCSLLCDQFWIVFSFDTFLNTSSQCDLMNPYFSCAQQFRLKGTLIAMSFEFIVLSRFICLLDLFLPHVVKSVNNRNFSLACLPYDRWLKSALRHFLSLFKVFLLLSPLF